MRTTLDRFAEKLDREGSPISFFNCEGQRVFPCYQGEQIETRAVVFLVKRGDRLPDANVLVPTIHGSIAELGNGWRAACVSIPLGYDPDEVWEDLLEAERLLLLEGEPTHG